MKKYKRGDAINGVFTVGQFLVMDSNSELFGALLIGANYFYVNKVAMGVEFLDGQSLLLSQLADTDDVLCIACTHEIHKKTGHGRKVWAYKKDQLNLIRKHYNRLLRDPHLYTNIQINFTIK